MPILDAARLFIADEIAKVPRGTSGVYSLEAKGQIIYYGATATCIRDRLYAHHRGGEGTCTQNALWFRVEKNLLPFFRERELLDEYRKDFGRPPKCNDHL